MLVHSGCTITGNYAQGNAQSNAMGGGVYCEDCSTIITNCLISDNLANYGGGGGIYSYALADTEITNCTIVANTASYGGGLGQANQQTILLNTILWDNNASTSQGPEIWMTGGTILQTSYSDVEGGQAMVYIDGTSATLDWGPGMMDLDPIFVTGPPGNYYLCQPVSDEKSILWASPCVDAGDPASDMIWGSTRTDGRSDTGIVDMGYHYPLSPWTDHWLEEVPDFGSDPQIQE